MGIPVGDISLSDTRGEVYNTCGVYTDEVGSTCLLLGVYDRIDTGVMPPSWERAYENGDDRASDDLWTRKRRNRPWYQIQGKHEFYIRYNFPEEAWCLYDSFANDIKGKWLCRTAGETDSIDPIGEKWVVHAKTFKMKI